MKRAAAWLAAAALALPGCKCASFPYDLDQYRCTTTADCQDGRSCEEGFCVLEGADGGSDSALPLDSGPPGDSGTPGTDAAPIQCTMDQECAPLTTACGTGTCNVAMGLCAVAAQPDGTACDDGDFCTDADACAAGACAPGPARDCSAAADQCNGFACDEAMNACVPVPVVDGSGCDDGLFCTAADVCTAGACGGAPNDCDDTNDCTADACDEGAGACVNDPAPLAGTTCDDGLFCTVGDTCTGGACMASGPRACDDGLYCTGVETCDEAADACASPGVPCVDDGFSCTVEGCVEALGACDTTLSEAGCGAAQVCNPVAYPGGATGCGAAPTALAVACPAAGAIGAPATCAITLTAGGTGVPAEAAHLACTAQPTAVALFSDDFTGGFDPAWVPATGTPATNSALGGNQAAVAVNTSWDDEVTLTVSGLDVLCVDFDAAQANGVAGDFVRWAVSFDGGALTTIFDLSFATWEADDVMNLFNRNVCATVPAGAAAATLRLSLGGGGNDVWVDNVAVSGVAAPFASAPGGGPDPFTSLAAWTTVLGAPLVGTFAGSSVLYAESGSYTIQRTIDATACDVLDVNFDFGKHNPNSGETIMLAASVDGGAFTDVELVNLNPTAWNVNSVLLPWLGLRRLTDLFPAAAGSASVVLRFVMAATGSGRRIFVDDFDVPCADLPDATVGAISDTGGGGYSVSVTASAPEGVIVTCTWATSNDGPIAGADTFQVAP